MWKFSVDGVPDVKVDRDARARFEPQLGVAHPPQSHILTPKFSTLNPTPFFRSAGSISTLCKCNPHPSFHIPYTLHKAPYTPRRNPETRNMKHKKICVGPAMVVDRDARARLEPQLGVARGWRHLTGRQPLHSFSQLLYTDFF